MHRRTAFTLVEVLVVISIIAVLVGILLPVLGRARDAARQVACLSNMHQAGLGLKLYAAANKLYLPQQTVSQVFDFASPTAPSSGLRGALRSMGKDARLALHCPNAERFEEDPWGRPNDRSDTNYLYNRIAAGRPLRKIPNPSAVIVLHEHGQRQSIAWVRPNPGSNPLLYHQWHSIQNGREFYSVLHSGAQAGNVCYADGHAELRPYRSLRSGEFGLAPDEPWDPANDTRPLAGGLGFTARW